MENARNYFITPLTWSSCPLGCQDQPYVSKCNLKALSPVTSPGCPTAMEGFLQVLTYWQCHWCCGSPAAWTRRKNPGFSRALGVSWCQLPHTAGPRCREKAGAAPTDGLLSLIPLGKPISSQLLDRVISAGKPHTAFLPYSPGHKHLLIGGISVYGRKLEREDL